MGTFLNIWTLAGLAQVILGILMFLFPPKYGNFLYGLSMKSTLKSEAHWKKGQRLCALASVIIGSVFTLAGVLIFFQHQKFRAIILAISFMCLWSLAKTMINKQLEKVRG